MRTPIVPALLAMSLFLAPSPAQAWSCAGKADGEWCHNNLIYICDNGQDVFADPCLYGCNEGDGPNADCSPAPCSGFCCNKNDGQYCNGSKLTTCVSEGAMWQETCSYGCISAGGNSYCADPPCSGYCCGKADGEWCHYDEIWICDNEEDVFIDGCLYGCDEGDGPNADCSPAPCSGYCCSKADGEWCHINDIWICDNEEDVFVDDCLYGCNEGDGPDADCGDPPCGGYCCDKADGEWCHNDEIWICDNEEDVFIDGCLYGCNEGDGPDADCSPAPCSGYCCGKEDGEWCHNNEILICDGGEDVFADPCMGGCVEGEGPDADCLPPPGFCMDKADGTWCDGDVLRTCQGGIVTTWSSCLLTCVGGEGLAACAEEGFCVGKLSGWWCHDGSGHLIDCEGGLPVDLEECDAVAPCEHMELGEDDVCGEIDPNQPPEGYCDGKPDTDTCWNDVLVTCAGGEAVTWIPCPAGCQINWPDAPDACADLEVDPAFCADKTDYWCYEDAAVVWCSGGIVAAVEECLNGCDPQEEGLPDLCQPEDPELFCTHHSQGAWCNGLYELVTCNPDGSLGGALPCDTGCVKAPFGQDDECPGPAGCDGGAYAGSPISVVVDENCCPSFVGSKTLDVPIFNQLAYSDKMGDCTGKTIASWGCLITSLSMFYEYMGVHRTLDGAQMTNNPPNENKWRKKNGGYLGCNDDNTCCMGGWTWDVNPPGFGGFTEVYNDPGGCLLSPMAAKVIAAELNAGTPLAAHVWNGSISEHWVLIVGVSASSELLLNDPGYGKKGRGFYANTGFGAYGGIVWIEALGGIGGGGDVPPWFEQPVPPEGAETDIAGGTVLTPEGEATLGHVLEPEIDAHGGADEGARTNCATGAGGGAPGVLLLLLFASAWMRCFCGRPLRAEFGAVPGGHKSRTSGSSTAQLGFKAPPTGEA